MRPGPDVCGTPSCALVARVYKVKPASKSVTISPLNSNLNHPRLSEDDGTQAGCHYRRLREISQHVTDTVGPGRTHEGESTMERTPCAGLAGLDQVINMGRQPISPPDALFPRRRCARYSGVAHDTCHHTVLSNISRRRCRLDC